MGSVFFGTIGSAAPMRTFKIGLVLSVMMFALLAAGVRSGSARSSVRLLHDLRGARLRGADAAVPAGDDRQGQHRLERADVRLSFAFQWGIGAVLRLYPVADGRYAPEGYAMALWILRASGRTLAPAAADAQPPAQADPSFLLPLVDDLLAAAVAGAPTMLPRRTCRHPPRRARTFDAVLLDLGLDLALQLPQSFLSQAGPK